jgi:ferrous-iron efflux pump FieF
MRWATYASVGTAVVLIIVKVIAWLVTDSVSILATLIDSSLDLLASMLNLVAVRHALQPADHEHRFGHGKAEALAGMGQALFIAGSAGLLLLQAAGRLIRPQSLGEGLQLGIGVMIFSMIATLLLVLFQQYVIKRTQSTAIKADALHYKTDLLVNGSVIIALLLSVYGWVGFDPIFALAIAAFILYSAWHIVREAIDSLMDHELPDEERDYIEQIVMHHPHAQGLHDLRTRRSGMTTFIQLHVELDEQLTLRDAHHIADEIEKEIMQLLPNTEVIIHEDPVILGEID